jgi:hypothetical protein
MRTSLFCLLLTLYAICAAAQEDDRWIRPSNAYDKPVWGVRNGLVFSIWPAAVNTEKKNSEGGPRGLIRIGYEYKGAIYLINFIAIEPVVNGKMEFSEISPSQVDGKWGKLMWAGDQAQAGRYFPGAITRGVISHPDTASPGTEELSLYIFMERFLNGAHPYLKVSIRSDRPEEICFELFHHAGSTPMERCAITATMGNYSRLRLLHLKDRVVNAKELYKDYHDIDFIEKEKYPAQQMARNKNGDLIAVAETDESFASLSSWPQTPQYQARWSWRYQPFFKVTQYWRKEAARYDSSLHVRVNGRATYWSGGSRDKSRYINIPGGAAFENFELREKYYEGQQFHFGISRKTAQELLKGE